MTDSILRKKANSGNVEKGMDKDEAVVVNGNVPLVGPLKPIASPTVQVKPKGKAKPKKRPVTVAAGNIALVVRANGAAYKPGVAVHFKGKKETALTEQGVVRKGTLSDFGFLPDIQPLFTKVFLASLAKKGIIPALTPASGQSIYFLPPSHKEGGCKMFFAFVGSNRTLTVNHATTLPFIGGMASAFKTAFSKAGGKGGDIKRNGGYAEYTASKGNIIAFKKAILGMIG
jgi:hypothetical protein